MQKAPQCFYRTSAKALILDDQKRFLLLLEDVGKWELPGGGLDHGETAEECIARELQEEMGVEVMHVAKNPSYYTTSEWKEGVWIAQVLYETTVKDLNFTPSDECVDLRFFTVEEARAVDCFPSVEKFLGEFNSKNH